MKLLLLPVLLLCLKTSAALREKCLQNSNLPKGEVYAKIDASGDEAKIFFPVTNNYWKLLQDYSLHQTNGNIVSRFWIAYVGPYPTKMYLRESCATSTETKVVTCSYYAGNASIRSANCKGCGSHFEQIDCEKIKNFVK